MFSCRLHREIFPTRSDSFKDFDNIGHVDIEHSNGRFLYDGFSARFHQPTICRVIKSKRSGINIIPEDEWMWNKFISCDSG